MHRHISQHAFLYRPIFWIVFTLASLTCGTIGYIYLPKALPILDLTITMDRSQALQKAREIATKNNLGPQENYRQAAYFTSGSNLQNYIELEAGGKESWQKLINSGKYYPYTWCIRHFKESSLHELLIQFTPTGKPYGFDEKISENTPGVQLSTQQAQIIAEKVITQWDIKLANYKIIESSQHKTLSNRLDHTFVYELKNEQIGESHYRFTVVVSGDKVTKLHHFMEIPEAFSRRYESMRSANNLLSDIASALVFILYIFIGCIIGLLMLIRQRWVLFKPAFIWALIIAAAQALVQINQLPLTWCTYNTAHSAQGHIMQMVIEAIFAFIYYIALYTLTFSAAESLTRKAFGNHIQFWQAWKNPVASSYQMLTRTLIGYGIVSFDFLFITLFYGIGSRLFGWWSPASTLIEPNILGTYVPWINALAQALGAGFWEECLFRAVPLATCALIGQRYNRRNTALIFGFILQAFIFGAAHANYPAQPWFIRLIELIIPSFWFGFIYLTLGLVPAIISHVLYDAILFGLPLFIMTGYNKYFVLLGISIPLCVIFYKRLRSGVWYNTAPEYYNSSWQPEPIAPEQSETSCPIEPLQVSGYRIYIFACLALASVLVWFQVSNFKTDIPSLAISKQEAIARASHAVAVDKSWQPLTTITYIETDQSAHNQHEFIWKNNRDLYNLLLQNYLPVTNWLVRFARFTGDLVTRAEEYHVIVGNNGAIVRISHQLPENKEGASLSAQKAREIAQKYLKDFYYLDPKIFEEISAASTNQPNRTDWEFNFIDRRIKLNSGQPRVSVTVAGDTVTDSSRYIYIPEDWLRNKQSESQTGHIINLISTILSFFIIAFALWQSFKTVSTGFPVYYTFLFALLVLFCSVINIINNWPDVTIHFATTQAYLVSIFMYAISATLSVLKSTVWVGIVAGACYIYKKQCITNTAITRIFIGICLGLVFTCVLTFSKNIALANLPVFPVLTGINAYVPPLAKVISYFLNYVQQTALIMLLVSIIGFNYSVRWLFTSLAIALVITSSFVTVSYLSWVFMLIMLTCMLLVLINYYLRWDTTIVPIIIAVPYITNLLTHIYYPAYLQSTFGAVCAILVLMLFANAWRKSLERAH